MMKSKIFSAVVGVAMLSLTACSTIKGVIGSVPTEPFKASICADGIVPVACKDLGVVQVPTAAEPLAGLFLLIAAPQLEQAANLKSCKFQSYPPVVDASGITAVATAVCTLNGVSVTENVTLKLESVK